MFSCFWNHHWPWMHGLYKLRIPQGSIVLRSQPSQQNSRFRQVTVLRHHLGPDFNSWQLIMDWQKQNIINLNLQSRHFHMQIGTRTYVLCTSLIACLVVCMSFRLLSFVFKFPVDRKHVWKPTLLNNNRCTDWGLTKYFLMVMMAVLLIFLSHKAVSAPRSKRIVVNNMFEQWDVKGTMYLCNQERLNWPWECGI